MKTTKIHNFSMIIKSYGHYTASIQIDGDEFYTTIVGSSEYDAIRGAGDDDEEAIAAKQTVIEQILEDNDVDYIELKQEESARGGIYFVIETEVL